jgi:predicted nucleotidyltransferase
MSTTAVALDDEIVSALHQLNQPLDQPARVHRSGAVSPHSDLQRQSRRTRRHAARSSEAVLRRRCMPGLVSKTTIRRDIKRMVKRIVQRFHPERIILFGSHARGDAGPDSDVDLLIVMPVAGSTFEKAIEIGVALHDIPIPKDIIVSRPEDFAWRKDIVGTIEWPAAHEGKVLYGVL